MMMMRGGGGGGSGSNRAMVAAGLLAAPALAFSQLLVSVWQAAGRPRRVRVGVLDRCCCLVPSPGLTCRCRCGGGGGQRGFFLFLVSYNAQPSVCLTAPAPQLFTTEKRRGSVSAKWDPWRFPAGSIS